MGGSPFDNMSAIMVNDPQYSRRGWKIAGIGLLLTFSYSFVIPMALWVDVDGYSHWYWSLFSVAIGTPIAFVGLSLSIIDKWRAGKRSIGNEILGLAALSGNAFFWATLGFMGP